MKMGSPSQGRKRGKPSFPGKGAGVSKKEAKRSHKKSSQRRSSRSRDSVRGRVLKLLLLTGLWGALGVGLFVGYCAYTLPSLEVLLQGTRKQNLLLYGLHGELIGRYGEAQKPVRGMGEVSSFVPKAIMAIEDRRFYEHSGVDVWGILRAVGVNLSRGGLVQGGSTLSQQLAKNLFLTPEKSLKRKVQEVLLALWLERKFSKEQLFLIYLNRVYWGSGSYGIGAAARVYFNKDPKNLTLYESAFLAGLLKAPSSLSPFSSVERAQERANLVLKALVEMKAITPLEKQQALATASHITTLLSQRQGVRYFGDWVVQEAKGLLGEKFQGDLRIFTTLDGALQAKAASRLVEALTETFGVETEQEGAVVILAYTGAVRAMVGGKSYSQSQFNRVTQAYRQPGSLFKIIVFLEALAQGMMPETKVSDGPVRIGRWAPRNHHWAFKGMVTLREAFENSINTATVRLAQKVGLKNLHQRARRMGIQTPLPNDLTIALGSGEVTLLEMTTVFGRIASGSETLIPYGILKITNAQGQLLYAHSVEAKASHESGHEAEIYGQMRQMLIDVVAHGTGHGAAIPNVQVGGKTGTSQGKKDALFIGFTPTLIGGIWMGYEGPIASKEQKALGTMGGRGPAKLFRQIFGP